MNKPNLFDYMDYRSYLKDFYQGQKSRNPSYSYRVFANQAKLNSANYLGLVIEHQRRITDRLLPQFIRGLKLTKLEAAYFRTLVQLEETRDVEAKKEYLSEAIKIRERALKKISEIKSSQYEILRHWRHCTILEMFLLKDCDQTPEWFASRLKGGVTVGQVKESIDLLIKNELLEMKEGKLVQKESLISTSDEVSSQLIRQLHRQFLQIMEDRLINDPIESREVTSLTIALPKAAVPEVKKALKEYRKELNKTYSTNNDNDDVYHLILGFFPLTGKKGEK